jgi:hypothetical protein
LNSGNQPAKESEPTMPETTDGNKHLEDTANLEPTMPETTDGNKHLEDTAKI